MAGKQGEVTDKARSWLNKEMTWAPTAPFSSSILRALYGEGEIPAEPERSMTVACWEMPLFAAFRTDGAVAQDKLLAIYKAVEGKSNKKAEPLISGGLIKYKSSAPPAKGDLVFWKAAGNELAHVALASGTQISGPDNKAQTAVYSFWWSANPAQALDASLPRYGRIAQTTIENLTAVIQSAFDSAQGVFYASPVW
jgi:hypothetical protein